MACGAQHSIAIGHDGRVVSWGSGGCGQLGHGETEPCNIPRRIEGIGRRAVRAACCSHSSGVVLADGTVWNWGSDTDGQLGRGSLLAVDTTVPGCVDTLRQRDGVVLLSCGRNQ